MQYRVVMAWGESYEAALGNLLTAIDGLAASGFRVCTDIGTRADGPFWRRRIVCYLVMVKPYHTAASMEKTQEWIAVK